MNNIINFFNISDKQLRVYGTYDEPYFVAKDVAEILQYKNTNKAIKDHVDKKDKFLYGILKEKLGDLSLRLHTILINKRGFSCLVQYGKKCNKELLRWYEETFGISTNIIKRLGKEEEYINYILEIFSGENMVRQYSCENYKIDLYFPDYKLAIECDEFGHSDRDSDSEETREETISQNLNCTFIRFNPDDDKFSINQIFNKIFRHIMKHNKQL